MNKLSLLLLMLLIAPIAHAQVALTGLERPLTLTLTPEYPTAGQAVQMNVTTYALDLDRSMVTWYVNDREIARGMGLVSATTTAGKEGEERHIVVMADDGENIGATEAFIRPTEVDLLWEAISYTPPFYLGRALPGSNSPIHLHALARFRASDGSLIPESDIIYTWYRNDAVAERGRGKSDVTLRGPTLLGADIIRVRAESSDGALSGQASVRIPSLDPFILFYEKHPLFGVLYHRSLEGSVNTLESEQKITAVPYFANVTSPASPSLSYSWKVNDGAIEPSATEPQTLTVTANGYTGPASIALELMSASDVFLHTQAAFNLVFGSPDTSFFSSLNPFTSTQ